MPLLSRRNFTFRQGWFYAIEQWGRIDKEVAELLQCTCEPLMKKLSCLFPANNIFSRTSQRGQAVLIILLLMSVVLTVALSIVSRSITDITISQKEEESSRAFSAAEAGIEQALRAGATTGTFDSGGSYEVGVAEDVGNASEYILPPLLGSGDTATVWFASHDDSGPTCADGACFTGRNVEVCWGKEGTLSDNAETPAIEMTVIYKDRSSGNPARVGRAAYDPNGTRRGTNKFSELTAGDLRSCIIGSATFAFRKVIDLQGIIGAENRRSAGGETKGPWLARIRLLYNTGGAHPVGVKSPDGPLFPKQGTKYISTGRVGDVTRKVEYVKLFSDLPPIFDFGLFSGVSGITKGD